MQFLAHFSPFCADNNLYMTKNIAIFASGSGSNAENIARYFQENDTVKIKLIVANKSDAYVLERARNLGIPSVVFLKKEWDKADNILAVLKENDIDFIVLAGFLLRIPEAILHAYPNKIINIHPALLPKYGGKGMYGDNVHKAVVAAGETESGITIHYVNEEYDKGEMIAQFTCEVTPADTYETVAAKVHALEYEHFPRVIKEVLNTESQKH
ncbi:phosphoribosylglycinamide formyltransferase [Bacteroides sp. 519]|uniref:phosphoribosylglycinamide formyltransferase n=1 Tax=Bacteroides sp. 519 TaxID=2302937 RepID=UPI0013D0E251|nr:phosphoribosylglycinamide formyltransferase [Bacteroides sp. 519]NDV58002.1 phosphoribosylglycinamide formyltransferase [Bacteroides sp. 519]